MLQSFRKYTQGWVATIIGIILSFAFVFWGIENYLSGNSKKNLAAKVNGKEITASQLNADYQRVLTKLKAQVGVGFTLPPAVLQQMKKDVLNNLILQMALIQSAYQAGFRITPYQISAIIRQMPEFQENGQFSKSRFQQIIARLNYTQPQFVDDIQGTLLLNQVASGIIESNFILPNELNQAVTLLEQKRDIQYVVLSVDQLKKPNQISEHAIKDYYERHRDQFKSPARLQIEYLQLSADELKKHIKISEQELNDYFGSNSDLNRHDDKVLTKAKAALIQQKIEQEFLSASDKLADLAYTHSGSLTKAANALGLPVQVSDYFTQSGGTTWMTKNPNVIAKAFSNELIKDHTNSDLIEIGAGNVVVLRVKDYQPERIQSLSAVQKQIRQTLMIADAKSLLKQKGEELLTHLKGQGDFQKGVAFQGLTVIRKQKVARTETKIDPQLLQLAFSIAPGANPVAGLQLANGDYAIVRLENVDNVSLNTLSEKQIASISRLYPEMYGKTDYEFYTKNQMVKAKVKTFTKGINE